MKISNHLRQPSRPSKLVVACPQMKNNKNVSMLARSASCFGVDLFVTTGNNKIDPHTARTEGTDMRFVHKNTILPFIMKWKKEHGFRIIGIECGLHAHSLYEYSFQDVPTMLIVGCETRGMSEEVLNVTDAIVEIPRFDMPKSLNVAVAGSIVLSEFAKQRKYIS